MITIKYPSVINGKTKCHTIDPCSPLGEQVIKLFHYSDNGSLQIIPIHLEIKVGAVAKSITVFVSTLSEKSVGYKKTINKRENIEKAPRVYSYYNDDPPFNSDDPVYDKSLLRTETFFEKIGRVFSEFFYSLR